MQQSGHDQHTPRWVKVLGIIALLVTLLFIVLVFTGDHGPGRHLAQ